MQTAAMTELLERAVAAARELPSDLQDEIAAIMLAIAGDAQEPVALDPRELATLRGSLDQSSRGEFASDERVSAIWAKHGL